MPESCGTCHGGIGDQHQAEYDKYADQSNLSLEIVGITSTANGATFNSEMTIRIEQNGQPYVADIIVKSVNSSGVPTYAPAGLPQSTFYTVEYELVDPDGIPANGDEYRRFNNNKSFAFSPTSALGGGLYVVRATGLTKAPEAAGFNGEAFGYVAAGLLETEGMQLYDNVASAALAFGDVGDYESAANVEGCVRCHGAPYMKHGYRVAEVDGLPDFAACKVCHYDTRTGGHQDWQWMVDDPLAWAEWEESGASLPADIRTKYAYTANLKNDVHMAHAMEFPYPTSMVTCAVCHEGKLDQIINDSAFKAETCKSCHPIQDQGMYQPKRATGNAANSAYWDMNRPPAFELLWKEENVTWHDMSDNCATCHSAAGGYIGPAFSDLHTGYNREIYVQSGADKGKKYADLYKATIESITQTGNVIDVVFSVNNASVTKPIVLINFYGWDSKDFIGAYKTRTYGDPPAPGFTDVARTDGKFEVKYDMATYTAPADGKTPSLLQMITDGTVKRAEIAVRPVLKNADNVTVAMDAASQTFNVVSKTIVTSPAAIVTDDNCNKCHDALGTTFHSADRGGNVTVCRMCHTPTYQGGHLEMQSRSIDSYAHAIHSFQAFDSGDVFPVGETPDPVEKARYNLHIEHVFPNFTILNCESCHVAGVYNVPDQQKSMGGQHSPADAWGVDRNIGAVPAYITGPASRACGGCHRAELINEDAAGELASFNQHTAMGGYLVEPGTDTTLLYKALDKIMTMFE